MISTEQIRIKTIMARKRKIPPKWAMRQRELISLMNRTATLFADRYTRSDGTLKWRESWMGMDGTDNGYEIFLPYPLFYLLGGGDHVHQLAQKEWDAITWQFTSYGTVDREFVGYFDWFHHSESYTYLFYLGLADPYHYINRKRALNFAAMYIGEDPLAPNWDAEQKMIRSPINGSKGPATELTAEDWTNHRPVLAEYLVPYEDLPGLNTTDPFVKVDWNDDETFAKVLKQINERMVQGDVPLNLSATTLVTHAYLYTGEDKYKQWVLDYLQVWSDRRNQNNGIMPDNIGPTGKIGELVNGKWWGGYYGWRWPHGAKNILEPALVAGCNAVLLTGDSSWLDLHRSQVDLIWSLRRQVNGQLELPTRHGDQGWFDYQRLDPHHYILHHCIHQYYISQSEEDLTQLNKIFPTRDGFNQLRANWPAFKAGICPPNAWFSFIEGANPDFSETILQETFDGVYQALERIEVDEADPNEVICNYYHSLIPVVPEGLIQMTMGTPAAVYNGGLLHTRVSYFDPYRHRPGLPEHIAALVDRITPDSINLVLVNTDLKDCHSILVQAGMFREHEFTWVRSEEGNQVDINGKVFQVDLGPSAQVRLEIGMKRFVHRPAYEFPDKFHYNTVVAGFNEPPE